MAKSPNMRIFNASVARDHGVYDACLVRTYKRFSNWTDSNFSDIPVEAAHFIEDTRTRIIETLRCDLSIPNFGTGTKSFLPTDLAYNMVRQLGARFHAQRSPMPHSTDEILAPLQLTAKTKTIVLFEDKHPLSTHHRARNERFTIGAAENGDMKQEWRKVVDPSNEDIDAARQLTNMSRPSFEELLTKIQPFLMSIDSTHIHSPLASLRSELRNSLEDAILTDDMRKSLFTRVKTAWHDDLDLMDFENAQSELAAETGDPLILEQTIDVILTKGFIDPLRTATEPDAQRREQLLRRKIILEGIFIDFVDQKNGNTRDCSLKHMTYTWIHSMRKPQNWDICPY